MVVSRSPLWRRTLAALLSDRHGVPKPWWRNYPLQYVTVGSTFLLAGFVVLVTRHIGGLGVMGFGVIGYAFAGYYYRFR